MTVLHQRTHASFVTFASECCTMTQKATNWGNFLLILMLILEPLINNTIIYPCQALFAWMIYFQEIPLRNSVYLKRLPQEKFKSDILIIVTWLYLYVQKYIKFSIYSKAFCPFLSDSSLSSRSVSFTQILCQIYLYPDVLLRLPQLMCPKCIQLMTGQLTVHPVVKSIYEILLRKVRAASCATMLPRKRAIDLNKNEAEQICSIKNWCNLNSHSGPLSDQFTNILNEAFCMKIKDVVYTIKLSQNQHLN